jgi:hypothetical protein
VLVRRTGGEWHPPAETVLPDEAKLQKMIAESPSLLPGVEGPAAVATEFGCSYGRIDIVGVDLGGQITVCECKTARNPELRRKVIGQIFAYAAALSGLTWEAFARRFEAASGTPLVARAHALAAKADEDDWDEETFRQETTRCLEAGEFRLVLAVEAIPDELRETVRFLNVHSASRLEVLALELSYRKDGEVEILVPHVWGEEIAGPGPRGGGDLDPGTLVALFRRKHGARAADAAKEILAWADSDPRLRVRFTGTGGVIEPTGLRLALLKLWPKRAVGKGLEVSLHTLADDGERWDPQRIEQFVQDLADIGVNLEPSEPRWPKAPLEPLADETPRQRFFELMEKPINALTGSA